MIRSMVESLADRLKEEPDDLGGWRRLARAYQVLGETKKAKGMVSSQVVIIKRKLNLRCDMLAFVFLLLVGIY